MMFDIACDLTKLFYGSSKTSLLNVLSGRVGSRGPITISADIRLDDDAFDPTRIENRREIAFVAQDNSLPVTSTPREAIRFSAKLRLSRETSEEAINALTERMILELGLATCADTMIGGGLIKGISGGECKRTSVGIELVVVSD
jgi:ABC-type multidrug transport system ATPase subunit